MSLFNSDEFANVCGTDRECSIDWRRMKSQDPVWTNGGEGDTLRRILGSRTKAGVSKVIRHRCSSCSKLCRQPVCENTWAGEILVFGLCRSEKLKIDEKFYEENDIHVHFPEGAVPKDGPSAGITMTTAIVSALTGKKVRADVAMTGEITLRGKVLPIGGLKEKSLAAYREGIYTVIMPKANERDLDEIAPEVKAKMKFIPVETIDEVLKVALVD